MNKDKDGESRTDWSLREWKSSLTGETQKFLCDLHLCDLHVSL